MTGAAAGGFARALAEQLARPHGMAGQWLGKAMDIANRRPTRLAVDRLAPRPGERVLDAGCGTGAAIMEVLRRAPSCRVTGIDPSPAMVAAAGRRLGRRADLLRVGLEELPFADGSFDAALALNMLYFCDAEGRMLASLKRALRPGGRLVVYVTHRATMESWPFVRAGLHRLFDAEELAAALTDGGFARHRICVQEVPILHSVRGLLATADC